MAKTRVYHLYASTSGAAAASLTITNPGRITGIAMDGQVANGANTTTAEFAEVALNSGGAASLATNDTPGNSLAAITVTNDIASSASSASRLCAGMSIPVQAGDKLYLHTGTGPLQGANGGTARSWSAYIYIES